MKLKMVTSLISALMCRNILNDFICGGCVHTLSMRRAGAMLHGQRVPYDKEDEFHEMLRELSILAFECFHEIRQCLNRFYCCGIINGSPATTDRAMSFEASHIFHKRFLNEFFFEFF